MGLAAAALAALAPAIEAARVEPVTGAPAEQPSRRAHGAWCRCSPLCGLALGVTGGAVLALATRSLVLSFVGLAGVVLGMALVAPAFTRRR